MKFKVGDRVVLACPPLQYGITMPGWTGVVAGEFYGYIDVLWDQFGEQIGVKEEHLVLDVVWDSPLMKALS